MKDQKKVLARTCLSTSKLLKGWILCLEFLGSALYGLHRGLLSDGVESHLAERQAQDSRLLPLMSETHERNSTQEAEQAEKTRTRMEILQKRSNRLH